MSKIMNEEYIQREEWRIYRLGGNVAASISIPKRSAFLLFRFPKPNTIFCLRMVAKDHH
jgi:hypothetical protein